MPEPITTYVALHRLLERERDALLDAADPKDNALLLASDEMWDAAIAVRDCYLHIYGGHHIEGEELLEHCKGEDGAG